MTDQQSQTHDFELMDQEARIEMDIAEATRENALTSSEIAIWKLDNAVTTFVKSYNVARQALEETING